MYIAVRQHKILPLNKTFLSVLTFMVQSALILFSLSQCPRFQTCFFQMLGLVTFVGVLASGLAYSVHLDVPWSEYKAAYTRFYNNLQEEIVR